MFYHCETVVGEFIILLGLFVTCLKEAITLPSLNIVHHVAFQCTMCQYKNVVWLKQDVYWTTAVICHFVKILHFEEYGIVSKLVFRSLTERLWEVILSHRFKELDNALEHKTFKV